MADWFDQNAPVLDQGNYHTYGGGGAPAGAANWQPHQGSAPPAAGGAAPPQGPQGGGFEPYSDQAFQAILHRYPPTNDGVRQAMAEVERTFGPGVVRLLDHPERLDKFVLPDGRTIDAVMGAGGANPQWGWMVEGAGGHGGAGGGALGNLGGMTGVDPSYDVLFKEGQKALERSAAAKGTLLTGGTLKALTRYGQDMASREFQNIFNRNFSLAGLGLNAAGTAAQAGSSYGAQAGNLGANYTQQQGNLITGRGNATAAGQVGSANAWGGTIGNLADIWGQSGWMNRGGGGGSAPPGYRYSVPFPNSPLA